MLLPRTGTIHTGHTHTQKCLWAVERLGGACRVRQDSKALPRHTATRQEPQGLLNPVLWAKQSLPLTETVKKAPQPLQPKSFPKAFVFRPAQQGWKQLIWAQKSLARHQCPFPWHRAWGKQHFPIKGLNSSWGLAINHSSTVGSEIQSEIELHPSLLLSWERAGAQGSSEVKVSYLS